MEVSIEHRLKYLERRKSEVQGLKEAVRTKNYDSLAAVGHRLKGNGETFGFPKISEVGIHLEEAVEQKDLGKLSHLINTLEKCIDDSLSQLPEN